ncbi:GAF domain-containing sensor histidine kinase [Mucilaginibacter sp. Bleaf8]|uniref:sensor histidine kinase n=1 Tax=Mucilaginibacter sp. Bleaf8 TaxID=2834430 RepID=UPI001BCF287A|nr:GAF domain-containing sensor histidine kinase [Mucilaginibacter sp. Bleaf8]MBS7566898.1 GAF domain-containing sensor histidine kinase [Mucilaginibacter sp. Bleaf8]
MTTQLPIPKNELERLMALSDFDLDYSNIHNNFKDLSKLAAKVAGADISMVNLIDSFTQWTVSNYGLPLDQMPREDSVCQYTIVEQDSFEVIDLSADDRFKDKFYVTGQPELRYYFGIPLRVDGGHHIGALCVLDTQTRVLTPEKVELLKIIADEIINRLKALKVIENLRSRVDEVSENQRRVAHDIRGPLGGIIGLAQIISEQGNENQMDEVLEFVNLIHRSGRSILELADEILSADKAAKQEAPQLGSNEFNQLVLKEKLLKLYAPQALNKKVDFTVSTSSENQVVPFSKNKLLQIIGNLVSNALKFTPQGGKVAVHLMLELGTPDNLLQIKVEDSGIGMDPEQIDQILNGKGESTTGTGGEQGYGFGLALVKHLIDSLKGTLAIESEQGKGTLFTIRLPQSKILTK